MREQMNRVLVIAAHADDETLGCGGTIAKHVEHGDAVHVLVLTIPALRSTVILDNVNARYSSRVADAIETRQREALRAAEILGVTMSFANFPEVRSESYALTALITAIERAVSEHAPTIVYTHADSDINQDHRLAHEATLIALRPWAHRGVSRVLGYAVDVVGLRAFTPRVFVALTEEQYERKLRALECYVSERREPPHPRSLAMIAARARATGAKCAAWYAEEFDLVWERI